MERVLHSSHTGHLLLQKITYDDSQNITECESAICKHSIMDWSNPMREIWRIFGIKLTTAGGGVDDDGTLIIVEIDECK